MTKSHENMAISTNMITLNIALVTCSLPWYTLQEIPITELGWPCYLTALMGKALVARGSGSCMRLRSAAVWARIERASSSKDWKAQSQVLVASQKWNDPFWM
jgi:hypothetical protein